MKPRGIGLLLCLVVSFAFAEQHSASATSAMSLDQIEAAALVGNPEVRVAVRRVATAETRVSGAGALDDPMLMYRDWGTPLKQPWNLNQAQNMFMLQQTFPGPGKRATRSQIMSLGGIAIAIGVLVDAGIVMTENVIRQAEKYADEHGSYREHIREITLNAAKVVGRPIFFAMVIIILAFVPVFALTGMEGKMFHPLAFTKTFAMLGSTILAVTLVPVLCTFLIRGKLHKEDDNPIMRVLRWGYRPVLAWALRRRVVTVSVAAVLFATAVYTATTIDSEFMPPLDEETALFMPITDPRISLTKATEIMRSRTGSSPPTRRWRRSSGRLGAPRRQATPHPSTWPKL